MKKMIIGFALMSLAVASAADTYRVTLFQPSVVNGKELKPGDYKLTLDGNKATIKQGKEQVEAQVKVEATENKFNATSVRYNNGDGKFKVQEIRIGNTKTKLVFPTDGQGTAAGL